LVSYCFLARFCGLQADIESSGARGRAFIASRIFFDPTGKASDTASTSAGPSGPIRFTDIICAQAGIHFKITTGLLGQKYLPETMGERRMRA